MSDTHVKIWKPEEFHSIKLSPLDTEIISAEGVNKYFVINVWETSNENPREIFLQINDLKVLNIEKDVVILETLNNDANLFIDELEKSIISLCKPYVKKLQLDNSALTYMSIISDYTNKGKETEVMKLRTSNLDYDPTYFFGAKKVDAEYLVKSRSKIIVELVDIQFDLENNAILPGFRLRQMAKISSVPNRTVLSEYSFVDDDSDNDTNTKRISRLSQNYDMTQTECMNDNTEDNGKIVNVSESVKELSERPKTVQNKPKLESIKEIYIKPRDNEISDDSASLDESNNSESTNSIPDNSDSSNSDSNAFEFPGTNGNSSEEEDDEEDTENMKDHIQKILSGLN